PTLHPPHRKAMKSRPIIMNQALREGVAERRNQVVHGAHKDAEGVETTLTMVRWAGDRREKRMTAMEISQLATEIHELGSEVWAIQMEILARALRKHGAENRDDDLAGR
ncbi:hypothetical protein, partial [Alteraurantiacibacter palmitatis]